MKPIEQAFLSSILESPDDDAPRLIYADWLEEDGQAERAEFIRVQCEYAQCARAPIGPCAYEPGSYGESFGNCYCLRCLLRHRERELLSENSPVIDWLYGGDIEWDDLSPVLCRGFIEEVTISLAGWLQHGPALARAAPLRVVRLSDLELFELADLFGQRTWVFSPDIPDLPSVFNDALSTFDTEADALAAMSRCCLDYAHDKDTKTVQA